MDSNSLLTELPSVVLNHLSASALLNLSLSQC